MKTPSENENPQEEVQTNLKAWQGLQGTLNAAKEVKDAIEQIEQRLGGMECKACGTEAHINWELANLYEKIIEWQAASHTLAQSLTRFTIRNLPQRFGRPHPPEVLVEEKMQHDVSSLLAHKQTNPSKKYALRNPYHSSDRT